MIFVIISISFKIRYDKISHFGKKNTWNIIMDQPYVYCYTSLLVVEYQRLINTLIVIKKPCLHYLLDILNNAQYSWLEFRHLNIIRDKNIQSHQMNIQYYTYIISPLKSYERYLLSYPLMNYQLWKATNCCCTEKENDSSVLCFINFSAIYLQMTKQFH